MDKIKSLRDYLGEQDVNAFETGIRKQVNADDKRNSEEQEPGFDEYDFSGREIGRIYELKKLYARLLSILQFLQSSAETSLVELAQQVEQSVDLFELLVDNLDKYIDNIDEIIIALYKYVSGLYTFIRDYFKKHAK